MVANHPSLKNIIICRCLPRSEQISLCTQPSTPTKFLWRIKYYCRECCKSYNNSCLVRRLQSPLFGFLYHFYNTLYYSVKPERLTYLYLTPTGISEPFEASSKDDKLVAIDPCEQACSSGSPLPHRSSKPSTAHTDIFTDFTGLDVANLSRHFSNDLSID